jgi:hypothetical protein
LADVGIHLKDKPLNGESGWKQKGQKEQEHKNFCIFCPFALLASTPAIIRRIIGGNVS